jgi:CRISPR/Cas system-associated exonuclease Cas4 (RecB family)
MARNRAKDRPRADDVSASELFEWAHCAVRYSLERVKRLPPSNPREVPVTEDAASGARQAHRSVTEAEALARVARAAAGLGAAALVLMLLLGLGARTHGPVDATREWAGALGAGLVMAAVCLLRLAGGVQHRASIPAGVRLLATDMGQNRTSTMREAALGIVGRPDYVFLHRERTKVRLVAAEVKPHSVPTRIPRKHLLQLAAGVLLVRAAHRRRAASFGFLVYRDRQVRVDLDEELREEVADAADAVRQLRAGAEPRRNHRSAKRCAICPFRDVCDQFASD